LDLLVRLFAGGGFAGNRLPSGLQLIAQLQGEMVMVELRGGVGSTTGERVDMIQNIAGTTPLREPD
jgi:hypothetical protein